MSADEIRAFREGDERALLEGLEPAFPATPGIPPGFRPRTPEAWHWAFAENPAGGRAQVALRGGEVVACALALPHRVRTHEGVRTFQQLVGAALHPDLVGAEAGRELLVATERALYAATCGSEGDAVSYGWPGEEAWQLGRRELRYEVVRTQELLGREPGEGSAEQPPEVERVVRLDEQAGWLDDRCCAGRGAGVLRDAAWLNWRYVDHPAHDYRLDGVRDGEGILRGLAVTRLADWPAPRTTWLVDWMVPPAEPEVADLLQRAVLAAARADGAAALAALFPAWSRDFAAFQERGWSVRPSELVTVAVQHRPPFDMFWLRDHWWYQPGDGDLV